MFSDEAPRSKSAGLGDERVSPGVAEPVWDPEHIQTIEEILGEARWLP